MGVYLYGFWFTYTYTYHACDNNLFKVKFTWIEILLP